MHKILFYNKFIICLYMFWALCAYHQEVKIVLYSIWYHHTCRWPSHMQVERGFCALSWLIAKITKDCSGQFASYFRKIKNHTLYDKRVSICHSQFHGFPIPVLQNCHFSHPPFPTLQIISSLPFINFILITEF